MLVIDNYRTSWIRHFRRGTSRVRPLGLYAQDSVTVIWNAGPSPAMHEVPSLP